jgi:formylglycine-generating enzyme required for sulfatase activity
MDQDSVDALAKLVGSTMGAYRLERLLGAGGMGAVFVGRHLQTDWERAIKVIRPEMAAVQQFRTQFLAEAKILDALNHPNILRVYELAQHETHLYLVTELLNGDTVGERFRAQPGTLKVSDVVGWFEQALSGVAEAHRQKVFHRDLKPENLFVTVDGKVKVLDFGIAKMADEAARMTSTQRVPGSPPYMAPDVIEGAAPSARSDVYAMGISLIETLAGRHPFGPHDVESTKSALSMMYAHVHKPLPDPRSMRADIPESVAAVIRNATAKKPEERYGDAEHMRLSLRAAASGVVEKAGQGGFTSLALTPFSPTPPAESKPAPAPRKGRGPGRWIALGALALLLAGAGGFYGWKRHRNEALPWEPPAPAAAPTPVESTETRTALNKWQRVAKPSGAPVTLGLPAEVWERRYLGRSSAPRRGSDDDPNRYENDEGLRAGVDTFSGPDFEMQEHEVTCGEWELWADPHRVPATCPYSGPDAKRMPVTRVPFKSAELYCRSLDARLPTEAEWEYAARGQELRPNPWGADPLDLDLPFRTNAYGGADAGPVAVETSEQDVTRDPNYRIYDLAGNAREWTATSWRTEKGVRGVVTHRAIRGLPLREERVQPLPEYSATFREKRCAADTCTREQLEELRSVGFRCVRNVPAAPAQP